MPAKTYYVYMTTNKTRTLYTGVTNNLEKRVSQHKLKLLPGFTSQYNLTRLVYFEVFGDIRAANPAWKDLSEDWYGKRPSLLS